MIELTGAMLQVPYVQILSVVCGLGVALMIKDAVVKIMTFCKNVDIQ